MKNLAVEKRAINARQRGVAAIMLVMMLPVMLGFITLGIESSRYMMLKGQLQNAAEAAALIVSAHGENLEGMDKKRDIATQIVNSMVSEVNDLEKLNITVTAKNCEDKKDCDTPDKKQRFYQYEVKVETTHNRWFPDWTGGGLSFEKTTTLAGSVISRKNHGTGVDVVFVSDFTRSMDNTWGSKGEKRIDTLKEIIKRVSIELEKSTEYLPDTSEGKNHTAFVPFHSHVWEKKDDSNYCGTVSFNEKDVVETIKVVNNTPGGNKPGLVSKAKVESVIDNIFKEGEVDQTSGCTSTDQQNCANGIPAVDENGQIILPCEMYTIPLTPKAEEIYGPVASMGLQGGTSSYEGIMRGARIAKNGKNPFRRIIVLTDGKDYDVSREYWHRQLLGIEILDKFGKPPTSQEYGRVEKGYCDVIRETLNREVSSGEQVESKIFAIGIGYNATVDPSLTECADKVYSPENVEELEALLLELVGIPQEIGTLHYKRNNHEQAP